MRNSPVATLGLRRLPGSKSTGTFLAMFLVAAGSAARAQDLDEQDELPVVQNRFELAEANFHQWVFGNGYRNVTPRDHLDSLLMVNVGEVDRACSLSQAQKRKLILAGHGDIKRFMDRVADARDVFDRLKRDQTRVNEIHQAAQPLAAALATGLFGDGSLFAKTLGATLDPEQAGRYRGALREKSQFRYRAKVSLALANLDSAVGFTTEQYRRFVDVILEETTPSEKPAGRYETQVVLLKIARLPEAKVRPIFDDVRWKELSRQLQAARGMEPFLRANGYIEAERPGGARKAYER